MKAYNTEHGAAVEIGGKIYIWSHLDATELQELIDNGEALKLIENDTWNNS